jgi:asparagine synthase (glutamine-hydrolysing)
MCGIAGFVGMQNDALLGRMTDCISYRGPDDQGLFSEPQVGLGHRRLSIIDLSRHGHQPMGDAQGRAVISYNGEIYNFREVRRELDSLGYHFQSHTDTEVVLNAYLAWGEKCLERFNGMFAFAIWDKKERSLFLARDRLGIKPLYYCIQGDVVIFASEIKSILCWDKIKRAVNPRALDYYLTFRYNHLDETLFENINKLPPGYSFRVTVAEDGRIRHRMHQYWDVAMQTRPMQAGYLADAIAEKLQHSVIAQTVSDVPIGALLSSGVDSSTIVGILSKGLNENINTFTVGFGYPGFEDELKPVRFTKQFFHTDHTEYICTPDMAEIIPKIIWHCDELNADPALIPTYLISEVARRRVKVVLSGEGSDEIFGGYERTMFMLYAWKVFQTAPALVGMIPPVINCIPFALLDKVFKYSSMIGQKGLERLSGFCRNINDIGASYLDASCVFNQREKEQLYGPGLKGRLKDERIAETITRTYFNLNGSSVDELFNRLSYFELKTRLPNDLLAKVDTMTMAHSLEARVPYLDHDLVEFAFAIPSSFKIRYLREKYILRRAANRYLPREIIRRRKDHFFVPIHLWLQNELRSTMHQVFNPEHIESIGYLNADFVMSAYNNYQKGMLFYARQLWNILFFLVWHKLYIETDLFLNMGSEPLPLARLCAMK